MTAETRASVLLELAKQVVAARRLGETAESLARRPLLLHRHVLRTAIDWKKIARALSEDRSRIYHWYRETHSRSILNVKMTGEDRRAIKAMIIAGVRDRSILGPDFYRRVHERFGMKYPRQELRMTYNNALRTQDVRAALEEHGVVPGPGTLSLQTGQGLLGPPTSFACVPCFPPAGYGGVPGCADTYPSKG